MELEKEYIDGKVLNLWRRNSSTKKQERVDDAVRNTSLYLCILSKIICVSKNTPLIRIYKVSRWKIINLVILIKVKEETESNNKGIYDDNLHNVGRNQIGDFYAFVGNFKMQNCVKYSIYSKYNIFNDI